MKETLKELWNKHGFTVFMGLLAFALIYTMKHVPQEHAHTPNPEMQVAAR